MAFVNELDGEWKTVDHERGFVLVSRGACGPDSMFSERFHLIHKGNVIKIRADHHIKQIERGKNIVEWRVTIISPATFPELSEKQTQEIITEAFKGHGYLSNNENYEVKNVKYDLAGHELSPSW